jgi:hypothetical protein
MTYFLVERSLPGMTQACLAALQRALREATHRLSTPSVAVRYMGSVYVPRRHTCLCLFEAADAELVRKANETAQAPYTSIQEAVALFADAGAKPWPLSTTSRSW